MTIQDLFERHFADQNDLAIEQVKAHRNSAGSYSLPKIATAFRYFSAGFRAKSSRKNYTAEPVSQ